MTLVSFFRCDDCGGSGTWYSVSTHRCEACHGSGYFTVILRGV